jgi:hypothetical protein
LETLQRSLRDSNIVNKLLSAIPKMPSKREPLFAENTNKLKILREREKPRCMLPMPTLLC